jgi:hypothetical protein
LPDMRIPEAFDVIVKLLGQERTRGARGTLLYALEPHDCSPILPLLVELVIADTYESAREAANCIVGIHAMVSDELWEHLKLRLQTACEAEDPQYATRDSERREQVIRVALHSHRRLEIYLSIEIYCLFPRTIIGKSGCWPGATGSRGVTALGSLGDSPVKDARKPAVPRILARPACRPSADIGASHTTSDPCPATRPRRGRFPHT